MGICGGWWYEVGLDVRYRVLLTYSLCIKPALPEPEKLSIFEAFTTTAKVEIHPFEEPPRNERKEKTKTAQLPDSNPGRLVTQSKTPPLELPPQSKRRLCCPRPGFITSFLFWMHCAKILRSTVAPMLSMLDMKQNFRPSWISSSRSPES